MVKYDPYGPKDGEYKEYEKLFFIQSNVEDYTVEQVDEYCVTVGALFKWLTMAIDQRIDDVRSRRAAVRKLNTEREQAIDLEEERVAKRDEEIEKNCEAAMKSHEDAKALIAKEKEAGNSDAEKDDVSEFNEDDFKQAEIERIEQMDPAIDIPEEAKDDVDNDYNLNDDSDEE